MPEQNKSIVWLHLSDLHFCKAKSGYDMHRVIDALYKDLKAMQDGYGLQPQLMFFTGDAAFGNYGVGAGCSTLQEQYQDVEQFLTKVRQLFSVQIPKDNLFLVPGNHDVDRNEVTDDQALWLGRQQDAEGVNSLIKQGGKQWQGYMERLAQYRNFLERYGYSHLLSDPERLIYHEVREVNGVKIGIGGFNSAWSCGKDQEKGKLWLGGDWQNGTIISNLKPKQADLKLALIHHPAGWFVEHEDHVMRRQMERDFDFFLHGHEHQGWVSANVDGHVRISAVASYERADQENGYNFVRLNLESGDVEVWLRKYDSSGGGWIPRIIGNGKTTNDGVWLIQNDRLAEKFKLKAVSVEGKNTESAQDTSQTTKPASIDRGDLSASFAQMKSQNPSPLEKTSGNQSESLTASQQSRQNALIKRLAEQFQVPELKPVVTSFIGRLNDRFPDLPADWDDIAAYLVKDGPDRHFQIACFLAAVTNHSANKLTEESIGKLFGYLLHTVIVKCHKENDKGSTRIPVAEIPTVELISACRNIKPHVPNYNNAQSEHKNSQKDPHYRDIGQHIPESGGWDVDKNCREIAGVLLNEFFGCPSDTSVENPIQQLADELSAYASDPDQAPLQTLYVQHGRNNLLQLDEVATRLHETLGNLLWIYVYGAQSGEAGNEWLHTSEGKISALVKRYDREIKPKLQSTQSHIGEGSNMSNGINISHIGSNTTVIVNSDKNNVQINESEKSKLLTHLKQLKAEANDEDLIKVSEHIENEIQKPEGADKFKLTQLTDVLKGFKCVESIAESISKVTQLLLPIIG